MISRRRLRPRADPSCVHSISCAQRAVFVTKVSTAGSSAVQWQTEERSIEPVAHESAIVDAEREVYGRRRRVTDLLSLAHATAGTIR